MEWVTEGMRGCKITLNYEALLHNLKKAKALAPNANVVAMVKANAYGHGLVPIGKLLDNHVEYLGVACLSEGVKLRKAGCQSNILLSEGFLSTEELETVVEFQLSIVLHHPWQVTALLAFEAKAPLDVWLKHESGMHRLGLNTFQFKRALAQLMACPNVSNDIKLMTHFSCADESEHENTQKQHEIFESLIADYPSFSASAANSAAILRFPKTHHQFIRAGLMLYGSSPFSDQSANKLGLKSVMTFSSKIIALRQCQAGDHVGYGGKYQCDKPTLIATVAAGYGDGYPRHISKEAFALIEGVKCPIVGAISMDMLTIDVTKLSNPAIEQTVLLWGDALPIETVAAFAGTITYDLLCRVGLQTLR